MRKYKDLFGGLQNSVLQRPRYHRDASGTTGGEKEERVKLVRLPVSEGTLFYFHTVDS